MNLRKYKEAYQHFEQGLEFSKLLSKCQHWQSNSNEPRHEKTCLREFPTRSGSNWPAQLQKLARVLKFRLYNLEILYYIIREQQRRWSDCADAPLLFAYDISHIFSRPGSNKLINRSTTKQTKWHVCPAKTQLSLCIHLVWSESSLCAQWVAKDTVLIHVADAQADPSLRWAHRSFCWFCGGLTSTPSPAPTAHTAE